MFEIYKLVFFALWVILTTIFAQAVVLIVAHRMQKNYKVGVIDASLGQQSFLFRSYRAFWNSVENVVLIFPLVIVGILIDYDSNRLGIITWVYAVSRIGHMLVYYFIATDRNPSLRSVFWLFGFFAMAYLIGDLGLFIMRSM
ncbi:MAG: hypothetical protein CL926_09395 [Deltaproteobacteria bacterium]|jgi:uncharacterized MAPEG superfamily protein|nr:hypothetical protein [Deltaproteobacteria bacterium]|tara:strand:+ start:4395 stop:4820 length:426 start_codon:yes stop_codon:yes gene_type:complete